MQKLFPRPSRAGTVRNGRMALSSLHSLYTRQTGLLASAESGSPYLVGVARFALKLSQLPPSSSLPFAASPSMSLARSLHSDWKARPLLHPRYGELGISRFVRQHFSLR
jgi:hypothetical protein